VLVTVQKQPGQDSLNLVSVPDQTNPSLDRSIIMHGEGGSGDSCHFFVFSAGICAEPIILQ